MAGLELVTADGDVVDAEPRRRRRFDGAVVHLGALGVVTRLTLDVVPSFEVRQRVYEDLPLDVLDDHFDEIMAGGYSVSMFTDWRAPRLTQVWIKSLAEDGTPHVAGEPWFGRRRRPGRAQPGAGPARPTTPPRSSASPAPGSSGCRTSGPTSPRAPATSCRPSTCCPREHAVAAVHALRALGDRIAPVLQICEIRTVAADELWLSPAYGQRQRGLPLHLAPRHRRGAARGDADRARWPRSARARTGASSSPPRRPTCRAATTACPTSSTSPGTTTPRASSATPTPPAA